MLAEFIHISKWSTLRVKKLNFFRKISLIYEQIQWDIKAVFQHRNTTGIKPTAVIEKAKHFVKLESFQRGWGDSR